MSSGFSIVPDETLKQMVAAYGSFKLKAAGSAVSNLFGRGVQVVTSGVLPTVFNKVPQTVATAVKDYFWLAPVALALSNNSLLSWNVALGGATCQLSVWDKKVENRVLVHDAAMALLATHTLRLAGNLYYMNPLGIAYDFACAAKLGLIIHNRNS